MEKLTLEQLTALVMAQAKEKGFGTTADEIDVGEKIALIHSEVTEAFEAYRHQKLRGRDSFEEEMGDVIQRVLHLCGALGVNVEEALLEKLEYNKGRDWDWDKLNEKHT